MGSGYAFRCEVCDGLPLWRLTRIGDVATTWACADHVSVALDRLQRDHEVTEVSVRHAPKAAEWSSIGHRLNTVAAELRETPE